MSEENVELIYEAFDAFNRQDVDAFVATASPDIKWEDSVFWSEHARIYTGKAELREWFNQVVVEPWESVHFEVEEITEAGDDRVFFGGLLTTRGKASGVGDQGPWVVRRLDHERQGHPATGLSRPRRGPQNRRAVGVGDVAGERSDGKPVLARAVRDPLWRSRTRTRG
jgi:ketosteroid isomerase-like protein